MDLPREGNKGKVNMRERERIKSYFFWNRLRIKGVYTGIAKKYSIIFEIKLE
jgi:hypothetical protein